MNFYICFIPATKIALYEYFLINFNQLLHRQIENIALNVIDADPVLSRRLTSLSLWMSLQTLGRDAIGGRITIAFESCRMFSEIISKCRGLRILVGFKLKMVLRRIVHL